MKDSVRKTRLTAEAGLLQTPLGRKLAERFPEPLEKERIEAADYEDYTAEDLLLTRHHGAFVKPCPGTRDYVCCGLQIIHFGLGCRLGCTYCILQGYLNSEALVLFGNVDQGLAELEVELSRPEPEHRRFCTGEFTDSLLLEKLTGLGARLTTMFAKTEGRLLELKTKTDHIDGLLDLDHRGRTVISVSVNAPLISAREESRAAPLENRLKAAARAASAGYLVGFHFDPIIRHPGWADGYRRTVDRIFELVPADRIAWISLGCFRYLPAMKKAVRKRHPSSPILDEEFIPAPDGKMRYPRPLRVEIYGRILEALRDCSPEATVYMCMESPRVWREVFGFDPGPDGLVKMLDDRVP